MSSTKTLINRDVTKEKKWIDKYDMHIQGWDTKHIEKEIN